MDLVGKIKEFDDFAWTTKLNKPNTLQYVYLKSDFLIISIKLDRGNGHKFFP